MPKYVETFKTIEQEVIDQSNSLINKLYPLIQQYTLATIKIEQCIKKGLQHKTPNPVHQLHDIRDSIMDDINEIIEQHILLNIS